MEHFKYFKLMFYDILTFIIVGVNCIELTKFLMQQKKKKTDRNLPSVAGEICRRLYAH